MAYSATSDGKIFSIFGPGCCGRYAVVEYPADCSNSQTQNVRRHQPGVGFWGLGLHVGHATVGPSIEQSSAQNLYHL